MDRVIVMGIGNPLVGDEGVGVRVAEVLMSSRSFPDGVDVIDAGTMGMGMLGLFREYGRVIVIDAVDGTGEPPGTLVRMSPEEIAPNQVLHSLHDVRLADVLEAVAFTGADPHVEFVGVQVGMMEPMVTDLTPAVEAAVPAAAEEVLRILEGFGIETEPRTGPHASADVIRAIRTREPRRGPDGS